MEIGILKWFDATFHSQTWLNYIMVGFTWLGEFGLIAIISAAVLLIFKKTRWAGVAVAAALIIDFLIVNVILKLSVNRARPWTEWTEIITFYDSVGVRRPTDSSFPSGHTAACFAAALVFLLRFRAKGVPAIVVAAFVAISRIYLCVHYPSDVLGGILIGSICGVAGHYIVKFIEKKVAERKSPPSK